MLGALPTKIKTCQVSDGPHKTIYFPQVVITKDRPLENVVNQAIVTQTQELINKQTDNMPTTVEEMIGLYELKNNQRQVLSLSLSNYTYNHQVAHGMTFFKSLTFDLKNHQLCQLKDLFKPGSDFVEKLSNLIKKQIKKRDIPLLGEFQAIKPNQDFYIADKTVVIYFQLYEITPYVYGFPMFPISVYDIQDIIDENGPLGRLIASH